MTLIISALLFSLSSNLDNLVVGTAYGIKKIKIGIVANLIIAVVTTSGTFLAMSVGKYISFFLSIAIANTLGTIIIIILGIYYVAGSIIKLKNYTMSKELALKDINEMIDYAEESDLDDSEDINIKEYYIIALGLTFNNLGTGLAASITGISIEYTVIATFVFSFLTIIFGEAIGNHILGKSLGKYAPLISGLLLIILGIIEFLN